MPIALLLSALALAWSPARAIEGRSARLFVLQPHAGLTDTPTATALPTRTPMAVAGSPVIGSPVITAPGQGQVINTGAVTVAWNAVATATGYDLRILNGASATVFSGSLTGNGATSTLIGLPQPGSYTVFVRACIGGGFTDAQCGPFASRGFSGEHRGAEHGADGHGTGGRRDADAEHRDPAVDIGRRQRATAALLRSGARPRAAAASTRCQILLPDHGAEHGDAPAHRRLRAAGARLPGRLRSVERDCAPSAPRSPRRRPPRRRSPAPS